MCRFLYSLLSHFCSSLGELVAAKQDVFLSGDPEWSPWLMQPQHVVIFGRDLGHVGPHRRVPAVVARGVRAHVDDGRVLGQRLPQIPREPRHKALEVSVTA